ncbi:MAG TPA: TetR/AcrR family transcriptional regulator [Streptosporangiaceae bacterium]
MVSDVAALRRRDRVRAATSQEIIQTARQLLIEEGVAAVSLRAIAREMGMTAPALYRYFGSHEELIQHVVADVFTELSDHVEAAVGAAVSAAKADQGPAGQPAEAGGEAGVRAGSSGGAAAATRPTAIGLIAACHAFRDWAVGHPAEFGMIFGSPLPGLEIPPEDPLVSCGFRFGTIFLRLVTEIWLIQPFDVPADGEIDPGLRRQLARYRAQIGADLPLGALLIFLRCWVQLYGAVSLEAFGHLRFALEDSSGMFELMLTDLAAMIGLQYPALAPGDHGGVPSGPG